MDLLLLHVPIMSAICMMTCSHDNLLTDPPSATVNPSSITVKDGEVVSLFCEAGGSGVLNVTWTMVDGSPLPVGVHENGNELFISAASRSHSGTYVCSVRNLAGTSHDTVTLNIYRK